MVVIMRLFGWRLGYSLAWLALAHLLFPIFKGLVAAMIGMNGKRMIQTPDRLGGSENGDLVKTGWRRKSHYIPLLIEFMQDGYCEILQHP